MTAWPASELRDETPVAAAFVDAPVQEAMRAISHPLPYSSNGPIGTFLISVLSFGLLPLWIWPRRWSAFADQDRQDILSIAHWWRGRASGKDLKKLDEAIADFRPNPILTILPTLAAGFVTVMMVWLLIDGQGIEKLIDLTFNYESFQHYHIYTGSSGIAQNLHQVWFAGLLVAYILHAIAVGSHVHPVRKITAAINRVAKPSNAPLIQQKIFSRGLNPLWIIVAVVLCVTGAWWGIPLVIGAAAQRKYYQSTHAVVRRMLLTQAQVATSTFVAPAEPVARAMPASSTPRYCSGYRCGAKLPVVAQFCPRCGSAV